MSRKARMMRAMRLAKTAKAIKTPGPAIEVPVVEDAPVVEAVEADPVVEEVLADVQADGVVTDEEEDQLRQLAKEKGISHWWSKSIERLQVELAEMA